jgi:hypothetical protein
MVRVNGFRTPYPEPISAVLGGWNNVSSAKPPGGTACGASKSAQNHSNDMAVTRIPYSKMCYWTREFLMGWESVEDPRRTGRPPYFGIQLRIQSDSEELPLASF